AISFDNSVFSGPVSFNGRKFADTTSFFKCNFAEVPTFHSCELNQDTSFEGSVFPPATGSEEAARAYRTLKLAFSKQQAIREEQRFFRLEMEEETLRETGLKRLLFQAYKTFSDYGFSITRPLKYGGLAVLVLTALYGLLSWLGQCGLSVQACHFAPQWLEFSLLQTLPLPGLDKLSEAASKAFWPQGAWWSFGLSALVILHKTLSLAVLFLIGLALRNLFKLK
ncbi:pentapeptide repeat-containing protein, partial [Limnohabitans sp.]